MQTATANPPTDTLFDQRRDESIDARFVPLTINRRSAIVPLSKGKYAVIDARDWKRIGPHRWWFSGRENGGYAIRKKTKHKQTETILMHRQILAAKGAQLVDHRDRNTLNNRGSNLRLCTRSGNGANSKFRRGNSKYKGVHWVEKFRAWIAYINVNYRRKHLGVFRDERLAAEAYDRAAIEAWGEFAATNLLQQTDPKFADGFFELRKLRA